MPLRDSKGVVGSRAETATHHKTACNCNRSELARQQLTTLMGLDCHPARQQDVMQNIISRGGEAYNNWGDNSSTGFFSIRLDNQRVVGTQLTMPIKGVASNTNSSKYCVKMYLGNFSVITLEFYRYLSMPPPLQIGIDLTLIAKH